MTFSKDQPFMKSEGQYLEQWSALKVLGPSSIASQS
jgi:hypothetical protein